MGKFDEYNINLKEMSFDTAEYKFQLDNLFFTHIDAPEVQKGNVNVEVHVKRTLQVYELTFHCEGIVIVICDRCLDEMEQEISTDEKLKVKFGEKYADAGEDLIIVPKEEGGINVAWFLYEFIALAVPMRHVHPAGKCNKAMSGHLKKHLVSSTGDDFESEVEDNVEEIDYSEEEKSMDSRWDDLKNILDNNN